MLKGEYIMGKKDRMPTEKKVKIVEAYISGEMGKSSIVLQYGVAWSTLRDWIRLYETRGVEGLMSYSRHRRISPETKLLAVREYLDGRGSHSYICKKYDIST